MKILRSVNIPTNDITTIKVEYNDEDTLIKFSVLHNRDYIVDFYFYIYELENLTITEFIDIKLDKIIKTLLKYKEYTSKQYEIFCCDIVYGIHNIMFEGRN